MKAFYTKNSVTIDGVLNEKIWDKTISYPLDISRDKINGKNKLNEKGEIRLAYDDNYLYLAVLFEDSDVIAQGKEDKMHHYQYGDVCELFLKTTNESYYWELYVTPAGKKTSFFFPSKGYLGIPISVIPQPNYIKVADGGAFSML